MKQSEYLEAFKALSERKYAITAAKNADYADSEDAFKNFRMIEAMTEGKIGVADGILVRMTDKMQRIANLLHRDAQVADEKIQDTLLDLSNYADILHIYLSQKNNS